MLPRAGMNTPNVEIDSLTEKIIGCAIEVHREMGPGLLESVYRDCLLYELTLHGIRAISGRRVSVHYKNHLVAGHLELDLLVEDCVVVELKAVDSIHPVHLAQVISYLKLTGCPAGLLMNFNAATLRSGLRRLDHPTRYEKKMPRSSGLEGEGAGG